MHTHTEINISRRQHRTVVEHLTPSCTDIMQVMSSLRGTNFPENSSGGLTVCCLRACTSMFQLSWMIESNLSDLNLHWWPRHEDASTLTCVKLKEVNPIPFQQWTSNSLPSGPPTLRSSSRTWRLSSPPVASLFSRRSLTTYSLYSPWACHWSQWPHPDATSWPALWNPQETVGQAHCCLWTATAAASVQRRSRNWMIANIPNCCITCNSSWGT